MPKYCVAYGCNNYDVKIDGCERKTFFRFPLKNKILNNAWVANLQRKDFIPTEGSRLCSDHFSEECFTYQPFTQRRQLKPGSVPTRFSFKPGIKSRKSVLEKVAQLEHWNHHRANTWKKEPDMDEKNLTSGGDSQIGAETPASDESSCPGITSPETKITEGPSVDINMDVQDGSDTSPLGLKISNVTSLKTYKEDVEVKTEVPQLSAKDENLQQLSTNVLPPYSPPPFPTGLQNSVPYESHCCTDCGDTFALKSSLTFHLRRKSVKITFLCDSCNDVQMFYNRCNLLSHIRAHSDKGEPSDIRNAFIKPLSPSEMQQIASNLPSSDEEDSSAMDTESASPTKLLEVSISEENTEQPVDNKTEVPSVVTCSECGRNFENAKSRTDHLTNKEKIPSIIAQCQRCGILCPSRCNFKAHLRIHLKVKPYICPECGIGLQQSWDAFFRHLKYECFHFSRSVGYKCSVCSHLLGSSVALQKHMMDLHTETYVKCQACPMAFKSVSSFQNHKAHLHSAAEVQHKLIFKCALCDIVFLSKEHMLSHLDIHIKDQVCQYVFNCMECNKATDSKSALYEHLQISHNKLLKSYLAVSNSGDSGRSKMRDDQPQRVECILCHCSFMTRQGYNIHNAKVHAHSKQHCAVCGLTTESKYDMVEHGRRHVKRGSLVCLLCHNREFQEENSLATHLFQHVETVQFPSYCPLCDIALFSVGEASDHFKKEHGLKKKFDLDGKTEPKNALSSNSVASGTSEVRHCRSCRKSFADWDRWKQHLLSEHKLKTDSKDSSGSLPVVLLTPVKSVNIRNNSEIAKGKSGGIPSIKEETNDQKTDTDSKKPKNSGYSCAKCDFESKDKNSFREHILGHKASKSTFQCQDCGLCFIVESSLRRHLKAIHKVADVDKYITEEGSNYTPEAETPSESANHSSLECSVCYTTFPSETSLKTHLRSHGMAFIQAKKTSVSTKYGNVQV